MEIDKYLEQVYAGVLGKAIGGKIVGWDAEEPSDSRHDFNMQGALHGAGALKMAQPVAEDIKNIREMTNRSWILRLSNTLKLPPGQMIW